MQKYILLSILSLSPTMLLATFNTQIAPVNYNNINGITNGFNPTALNNYANRREARSVDIVDGRIWQNNNNPNRVQTYRRKGLFVFGSKGSIEQIRGNLLCSKTKCSRLY